MTPEPIFDLAHLGHVELLTPKPDASLKFSVDVMGAGRNLIKNGVRPEFLWQASPQRVPGSAYRD
jgi:catechol 2,3-dioxygenase-like lactoylglutathione lyase family enzyme